MRDGASLSTYHLIDEFLSDGHDVVLATCGAGDLSLPAFTAHASFQHARFAESISHPLEISTGLLSFLNSEIPKADVFLLRGTYSLSAVILSWFAAFPRTVFAVNPLGNLPQRVRPPSKSPLAWFQLKLFCRFAVYRLLRKADVVICASAAEEKRCLELAPRARTTVIENGVQLNEEIPTSVALDRYALFLGRITPEKNIEFLLELWNSDAIRKLGLHLLIAGDSPESHSAYRNMLDQYILQHNLQSLVRLVPAVSGAEKEDVVAKATLLLLPSHFESFGNVVLEALAAGIPALVSDQTCWHELRSQQLGDWLPLSTEEWQGAVEKFSSLDLNSRQLLGARARAFISSRFSWRGSAQRYLAVFSQACTKR